jgi:hypothetical protein
LFVMQYFLIDGINFYKMNNAKVINSPQGL